MALVVVVLLMFLSNVRSALIVAINMPLALLFAFAVLYPARQVGQFAVDRGGRFRDHRRFVRDHGREHLPALEHRQECRAADGASGSSLPRGKSSGACSFSTVIMVCAFLPLFTMAGPEGQIFGPMAETYAFALGGAMLLALVLSPVLCDLLLPRLKPGPTTCSCAGCRRATCGSSSGVCGIAG